MHRDRGDRARPARLRAAEAYRAAAGGRAFHAARGIVSSSSFFVGEIMVLIKSELIGSLQNEVRILLHLASKIDRAKLDYRPSPKQRSTLDLLRYLSIMGPGLVEGAKAGKFDPAIWTEAQKAAEARDFDQTIATIGGHSDAYAKLLGPMSDADFRAEINMFGSNTTRGAFIVNLVLGGCAAYRTQLFLYLKAGGRDELSTMNLWAGMDAPPPA
jgi:hypothetical protein